MGTVSCIVAAVMDQANARKLLRLAKKYLLPRVRTWWKQRQAQKQQQQQQQQQQPQQQYQQQPYQQQQPSYAQAGQHQQQPAYHASNQQPSGAAGGFYGQQPPAQQQHGYNGAAADSQHAYKPPSGNVDMQNASNPEYVSLRNQAISEGQLMHEAFEAASRAYKAGDGASAKELSNKGHQHDRNKDELNQRAADWIFEANNRGRGAGEIDLHGLYVQEAIDKTEAAVQNAQRQGLHELRIITGKGIHSQQGVAKIKPAIESLMVKYNLSAHLDSHNSGVLVVNLAGGGSRDLGWVDQADREADDGQCVIM